MSSSSNILIKVLNSISFGHYRDTDISLRFHKLPINSVEILTLKEKLYFQFYKIVWWLSWKDWCLRSHTQTYFLFFHWSENQRHFPWLLTSSLACPAIRSLNMFSLATLVSLVLGRPSSFRVIIRVIGDIAVDIIEKLLFDNFSTTNFLSLVISFSKLLPSLGLIFPD